MTSCLAYIQFDCNERVPFLSGSQSTVASTITGGPVTECMQGIPEALTLTDIGDVEKSEEIGDDSLWSVFATGRWAENTTLLLSKSRITSHKAPNHTHCSCSAAVRWLQELFQALPKDFWKVLASPKHSISQSSSQPLPNYRHKLFWCLLRYSSQYKDSSRAGFLNDIYLQSSWEPGRFSNM